MSAVCVRDVWRTGDGACGDVPCVRRSRRAVPCAPYQARGVSAVSGVFFFTKSLLRMFWASVTASDPFARRARSARRAFNICLVPHRAQYSHALRGVARHNAAHHHLEQIEGHRNAHRQSVCCRPCRTCVCSVLPWPCSLAANSAPEISSRATHASLPIRRHDHKRRWRQQA